MSNAAAKKANELLDTIAKHGVQTVLLRYGTAHASIPPERLDAAALLEGIALEPGTTLVPDLDSAHLDPFAAAPALVLVCDLLDAADEDPRRVAKRAEARLTASGFADSLHVGSELRYYVFDEVAYENAPDATGYQLDAIAERELEAIRAEVLGALKASGVEAGVQRSVAGAPGQTALDLRAKPLTRAADSVFATKIAVKAVAARHGKSATFMPKPLAGSAGSALRVRMSPNKDGKSPFFDKDGWAAASQTMLFFIGGLLAHADSLLALCAPSANSYTHFASLDVPLLLAFGRGNAATAVTVDAPGRDDAKTPRVEFRAADLSANPYLAFAALLCAGLDGLARRTDPISSGFGPLETGATRRPAKPQFRGLAPHLGAALDALEKDRAYLTEGGVFGDAFLRRRSEALRANEIAAFWGRPHPLEYALTYEC